MGWFFSTDNTVTLKQLVTHWQARLILIYEGQKVFYRFQDNRTIVRPLKALPPEQTPRLLGELHQLAAWDGQTWYTYTNSAPNTYPLTTQENLPWALPDPDEVIQRIRFINLYDWLINTFTMDVFIEANLENGLDAWLTEQLSLINQWQWEEEHQWYYLLEQRLDYQQRHNQAWQPLPEEQPNQHYQRMLTLFTQQLPKKRLTPILDTEKLQ